jgi:hypothetical protein
MFNPILVPILFIIFSLLEINNRPQAAPQLPKNWVKRTKTREKTLTGLESLEYLTIQPAKLDDLKIKQKYVYNYAK